MTVPCHAVTERVDVTALASELGPVNVTELAERSGLTVDTVRDVMAGRLRPSPWVREKLARGLGLEPPAEP